MLKLSYHIATVFGVPIRLHISLILLVLYLAALTGSLAAGFVVVIIVAFSVILHELGHTFVALRFGTRVREIDMLFIGGMAVMENMPERPRDELLMAAAGPAVSLALGIGSMGLFRLLGTDPPNMTSYFFYGLARLNLALFLFNLLPAFPLDGGRMLRATLSQRIGRLPATFIASRIGKSLAVALGLFGLFRGHYMLIAIAFFIYHAAEREYRAVRIQTLMNAARWTGDAFSMPGFSNNSGDSAIVAPPPYERGRRRRVDLYTDNG